MGRYFFGLNLANSNKQDIANWRKQYLPNDTKSVTSENFHITLLFLGNVDEETMSLCVKAVNHIYAEQFSISLNNIGFWAKPKVLFLGSDRVANNLVTLVEKLTNIALELAVNIQQRPYIPHLTLCRKAKHLPDVLVSPNFNIEFSSFCLYESISTDQGVKYKVIHSWPLR